MKIKRVNEMIEDDSVIKISHPDLVFKGFEDENGDIVDKMGILIPTWDNMDDYLDSDDYATISNGELYIHPNWDFPEEMNKKYFIDNILKQILSSCKNGGYLECFNILGDTASPTLAIVEYKGKEIML
jgi:hypothetical protein